MPKKIDSRVRDRAVRLVLEHRAEYPSNAKAIAAVARQEGVGAESLRRWVIGIGVAGSTSKSLAAVCDEYIDYDDVLDEMAVPEEIAAEPEKLRPETEMLWKAPIQSQTTNPSLSPNAK